MRGWHAQIPNAGKKRTNFQSPLLPIDISSSFGIELMEKERINKACNNSSKRTVDVQACRLYTKK
jgi:uncharacterized membrane protein